jgi:hypothetical protein
VFAPQNPKNVRKNGRRKEKEKEEEKSFFGLFKFLLQSTAVYRLIPITSGVRPN